MFGRKKAKDEPLSHTYTETDEGIVIALKGRLDSVSSGDFQTDATPRCKGKDVTLDLEGLTYLSSAGLRVILTLDKTGRSMKIVNAKDTVKDVLDMSGFSDFF